VIGGERPVREDQMHHATDGTRPPVSVALGNALPFAVDGGVQAAANARAELVDRLALRLDREIVEVARLLLSELVTNCVLHGTARGPEVSIEITVSLFPDVLSVEVHDGGPVFHHQPGPAPAEAGAGRGLYLVDQLATRWGISGQHQARVWFELQRVAGGRPPAVDPSFA
jgi:anti-sigma regulatory factor (Ser/Thr protein kinase)